MIIPFCTNLSLDLLGGLINCFMHDCFFPQVLSRLLAPRLPASLPLLARILKGHLPTTWRPCTTLCRLMATMVSRARMWVVHHPQEDTCSLRRLDSILLYRVKPLLRARRHRKRLVDIQVMEPCRTPLSWSVLTDRSVMKFSLGKQGRYYRDDSLGGKALGRQSHLWLIMERIEQNRKAHVILVCGRFATLFLWI